MTHRVGQFAGNGRARSAIDWEAQWVAHHGWLRTVIAARVGEPAAVDDLLQEVAVAAVEQRAAITDPAKIAPWLYRVAVISAVRYRRGQARRRKHETRGVRRRTENSETGVEEIPVDWLLLKERRQLVREALGRLSGRDAEILMLKYLENFSYRDLAERLGISTKAVDSRLLRARARLRAELETLTSGE